MRKQMTALIALLAALVLCAGALAENTAEDLYNQVTDLLFYTDNITLKVKAEFSLDGEWFKTLDGLWQQDYDRSVRQVLLTAPKEDGTERQNGYTIVSAGSQINVMEVFTPGVYKTGTTAERNSILHRTVQTDQLIRLGRVIVSQTGNSAVTKDADGTIRMELDDRTPEIVNVLLTEAAQFAVKRYFSIDPDTLNTDSSPSVWYYNTISEGLMYCMRNLSLQRLTAEVTEDEQGRLKQAKGEMILDVDTATDGVLVLGIKFEAEVSDRGTTMVRKFHPDDYGVTLAEEGEEHQNNIEYMDGEQIGELSDRAMKYWGLTGYPIGRIVADSVEHTSDGYNVLYFIMEDGIALKVLYDEGNTAVVLETDPHSWENMELDYEFDPQLDEAQDAKIKAMLNTFLREVNPELAERLQSQGMVLRADRRYEIDGVTFVDYCEDPLDQEGTGVLITVRMDPEPAIEYYAAVSNG